jgi:hypothetical protein
MSYLSTQACELWHGLMYNKRLRVSLLESHYFRVRIHKLPFLYYTTVRLRHSAFFEPNLYATLIHNHPSSLPPMIHTSVPLRTKEHRAPVGNMVTLPSIRELGLWGAGGAGRPASPPSLRRSQTSMPSSIETYPLRHIKSEDHDASPCSLSPLTYGYHPCSSVTAKCE